jgi:hypothetical protein
MTIMRNAAGISDGTALPAIDDNANFGLPMSHQFFGLETK